MDAEKLSVIETVKEGYNPLFINLPTYIKGEIGYSYLLRCLKRSCYLSTSTLIQICTADPISREPADRTQMPYDLNHTFLNNLFSFADGENWVETTTLEPLASIFHSDWITGCRLRGYTFGISDSSKKFVRPSGFIKSIRVCPECMKEEKAKGTFRFHKEHQVPGVTACHKHGCGLLEYTGHAGYELTEDRFTPLKRYDGDVTVALFAHHLIESRIQGNLNMTIEAISSALMKRYGTETFQDALTMFRYDTEFSSIIRLCVDPSTILLKENLNRLPYEFTLRLLCRLYHGDVNELLPFYTKDADNMKSMFLECIKDRFDLLSPYSGTAVTLKCRNCGFIFHTAPHSVLTGWGCPKEDAKLTDDGLFRRLIKPTLSKGWTLSSLFTNWGDYVKITDGNCTRKVRAYLLVEEELQTRTGSVKLTMDDLRKEMEKHPGFELLESSGVKADRTLLLRHKSCGNTFTVNRNNFLKSPFCRVCEGSASHFHSLNRRERIKKASGGLFELTMEQDADYRAYSGKLNKTIRAVSFFDLESKVQRAYEKSNGSRHLDMIHTGIELYFMNHTGEIITIEDLYHFGSKRDVSYTLRKLVNKGIIRRIGKCIYCNRDDSFSPSEVIRKLYSEHIPLCDSLLSSLGARIGKPNHVYAKAGDLGKSHMERRNVNGVEVMLDVPPVSITKENTDVLELIMTINRWEKITKFGDNEKAILYRWIKEKNITYEDIVPYREFFRDSVIQTALGFIRGGMFE